MAIDLPFRQRDVWCRMGPGYPVKVERDSGRRLIQGVAGWAIE